MNRSYCLESDCEEPVFCKGRCRRHHQRLYMRSYRGSPALKRAKSRYSKSRKGRQADAKYYIENRTEILARARRYNLRVQYGITEDDYSMLLKLQNGRCGICRKLPCKRRLSVDHCHKSGAVRGLLCTACNHSLVAFERDKDWVTKTLAYLAKVGSSSGIRATQRTSS